MTEDFQNTIDRIEIGTGWVCFQAGQKPPARVTLPIVENGTRQMVTRQKKSQTFVHLPVLFFLFLFFDPIPSSNLACPISTHSASESHPIISDHFGGKLSLL